MKIILNEQIDISPEGLCLMSQNTKEGKYVQRMSQNVFVKVLNLLIAAKKNCEKQEKPRKESL